MSEAYHLNTSQGDIDLMVPQRITTISFPPDIWQPYPKEKTSTIVRYDEAVVKR